MQAQKKSAQADPHGVGRWLVLAGVWLVYFSFGVTIASMAPLVGPISADLSMSNAAMGLILGAWPLTYIVAAIPCGILLDRFGARKMLFAATVVMAASGLARSMADTPMQLLLAVGLFGAGGPMISVGAPKLIAELFEGRNRGTAMGIYVTGPYLGGVVALALTNSLVLPLVDGDWRGVMLVYAGLVVFSGLIWLVLSAPRFLAAPAAGAGGGKKFNFSAFMEILNLPEVRVILVMSIGIFFINHALNNWLPEILRSRNFTPVAAGYWAALAAAVGVAGAIIVPRLATPDRRLAVLAALFLSALLASLLLHSNLAPLLATGLILQGLARGAMMTVAILILMETPNVPPERLGLAGGLFFTTAEVGGVLGPITFGVLSDMSGGFTLPLVCITLVCLGLCVLLWLLQTMHAAR